MATAEAELAGVAEAKAVAGALAAACASDAGSPLANVEGCEETAHQAASPPTTSTASATPITSAGGVARLRPGRVIAAPVRVA